MKALRKKCNNYWRKLESEIAIDEINLGIKGIFSVAISSKKVS